MPVETARCWWLLKIETNVWAGGKGSCAVCVDLQAVGALEFFGEFYQRRYDMRHEMLTQRTRFCIGEMAKKGTLSQHFVTHVVPPVELYSLEREGSIFSSHQHFAVSKGIAMRSCMPSPRFAGR